MKLRNTFSGYKMKFIMLSVICITMFNSVEGDQNNPFSKGLSMYPEQQKETISFSRFLSFFTYPFPREIYLSNPPKGKMVLDTDGSYLNNYTIRLDNGKTISDITGYAHSYRMVSRDVYWFGVLEYGSYGGDTGFYLHVINTRTGEHSGPYVLASVFGDAGMLDYKNGKFINDSTFRFQQVWTDADMNTDSTSGSFVIR